MIVWVRDARPDQNSGSLKYVHEECVAFVTYNDKWVDMDWDYSTFKPCLQRIHTKSEEGT